MTARPKPVERPGRPARPTRRAGALVVGCLLAVAVAGCSRASSAASDPRAGVPTSTPGAEPTSTGPAPTPSGQGPVLPLTGLPAPDAASATRPIVAVPVDAGTGVTPSTGLDAADLVWVTFPNPHRQRALGLFQSRDTTRVGPVGDTRPIDAKLLRAVSVVLEHSGGTAGFIEQVERADLPQWSSLVQPSSFSVDAAGNVFGATAPARAAAGVKPATAGLLSFTDPAPGIPPVSHLHVQVTGQDPVDLQLDPSGTWRGTVGTLPVAATNVVVQQVAYATLVLPKTAGATEGNPDPDGSGPLTLVSSSRAVTGTWSRQGFATLTRYASADGNGVRLFPGTTWVLLVPTGTAVQAS